MFIDIMKCLQQIPESSWNLGNESRYTFKDGHFIKCLRNKVPDNVHSFFTTNKMNNAFGALTPQFERYYYLTDSDIRNLTIKTHRHIYVFEKAPFTDLRLFYNKRESKDTMVILDDLQKFFFELDQAKVVYQDACWENIGCNKITGRLCVIDMDSMVETTNTYEKIKNFGSPLFHTSFLKFKDKYGSSKKSLCDVRHLNLCTFHNILFAFVVGLAANDTKYTFMKNKSAINSLVGDYINGKPGEMVDGNSYNLKLDAETIKVLKSATQIVSMCINDKYIGMNPYEDMVALTKDLIGKAPSVRVPQPTPASSNTPRSSTAPDVWSKHLPRTSASTPSTSSWNSSGGSHATYNPPPVAAKYSSPPARSRVNNGPHTMLMLAQLLCVVTTVFMIINMFTAHPPSLVNNTTSNSTVIGLNNTTLMDLSNSSNVSGNIGIMNATNLQTFNLNSTSAIGNSAIMPLETAKFDTSNMESIPVINTTENAITPLVVIDNANYVKINTSSLDNVNNVTVEDLFANVTNKSN